MGFFTHSGVRLTNKGVRASVGIGHISGLGGAKSSSNEDKAREQRQIAREEAREAERERKQLAREREREERAEAKRPKDVFECQYMNEAKIVLSSISGRDEIIRYINDYLEGIEREIREIHIFPNIVALAFTTPVLIGTLYTDLTILIVSSVFFWLLAIIFLVKKMIRLVRINNHYKQEDSKKNVVISSIQDKLESTHNDLMQIFTKADPLVKSINQTIRDFVSKAQALVEFLERHIESISVKNYDRNVLTEIKNQWKEIEKLRDNVSVLEREVDAVLAYRSKNIQWTEEEKKFTEDAYFLNAGYISYTNQTFFGFDDSYIATDDEWYNADNIFKDLYPYCDMEDAPNAERVKKIKSLEKKAVTAIKKLYHDSNTKVRDM